MNSKTLIFLLFAGLIIAAVAMPAAEDKDESDDESEEGGDDDEEGNTDDDENEDEDNDEGGDGAEGGTEGGDEGGSVPGFDDNCNEKCNNCRFSAKMLPVKTNCLAFYQCANGVRYDFSCSRGTVFDPALGNCNHAWASGGCGDRPMPSK